MALKIERGPTSRAVKVLLAGVASVGKTTLAASLPNPLFLDVEDGLVGLEPPPARVRCRSWADTQSAIMELGRGLDGVKTVVIDSADWAEKQMVEAMCQRHDKTSIEQFGFGKGWVMAAEQWAAMLAACDAIVARGISVVLIGHVHVKRENPPDLADGFDRYTLKQSKHIAPLSMEWADVHAFLTFEEKIVTGTTGRKRGIGGKRRVAHTERSAAWDAKNRFGWEPTVDLDDLRELLAGIIDGATAAPPPELVPDPVVDERPGVEEIRIYLSGKLTPKQLKAARERVIDLGADGNLSAAEVDEFLGTIDQKAVPA